MSKPSYGKKFYKPPPKKFSRPFSKPFSKPSYGKTPFGPSHIPYKNVDIKDVEGLFAKINTGEYSKIMNFISSTNITLNVTNKQGENPLHIILKNVQSETDETEIYKLAEYFVNNGVSVSAFDKKNITPLHLAAKYQFPSIVKLFLSNGADPNATDNQNMTPLHYATQGYIVDCLKIKNSKLPKMVFWVCLLTSCAGWSLITLKR